MLQRRCPSLRCIAVLVLFPVIVLTIGEQGALAGKTGPPSAPTAYAFARDLRTEGGEVVAFDMQTGRVLYRLPQSGMIEGPELSLTPTGDRLLMLGGILSKSGKSVTNRLSVIDAVLGKLVVSIPVPQRMRYIGLGPGTMVLAPHSSRLFVYSFKAACCGRARYWLTAISINDDRVLPRTVALPGCGPAFFTAAQRWIVALCTSSNDVRFVDPRTLKVAARTHLPSFIRGGAAALLPARSGMSLYIVSADLRIVELSTAAHKIVRVVSDARIDLSGVSLLYSAVITADGRSLVVGSIDRPKDPASSFSLHVFLLPALKPVRTIALPHFTHFTAAPGGGLFAFPMGDSSDNAWNLQFLNPDLSPSRTQVDFHGPIVQVVVPATAFGSHISGGAL